MVIMALDVKELSYELRRAMETRDARTYARLADKLGYDDGSELHRELMDLANMPYLNFYADSVRLKVDADNISANPREKREILTKFDDKFARGGKQDLTGRNSMYIGTIFKDIYSHARQIHIAYNPEEKVA